MSTARSPGWSSWTSHWSRKSSRVGWTSCPRPVRTDALRGVPGIMADCRLLAPPGRDAPPGRPPVGFVGRTERTPRRCVPTGGNQFENGLHTRAASIPGKKVRDATDGVRPSGAGRVSGHDPPRGRRPAELADCRGGRRREYSRPPRRSVCRPSPHDRFRPRLRSVRPHPRPREVLLPGRAQVVPQGHHLRAVQARTRRGISSATPTSCAPTSR